MNTNAGPGEPLRDLPAGREGKDLDIKRVAIQARCKIEHVPFGAAKVQPLNYKKNLCPLPDEIGGHNACFHFLIVFGLDFRAL